MTILDSEGKSENWEKGVALNRKKKKKFAQTPGLEVTHPRCGTQLGLQGSQKEGHYGPLGEKKKKIADHKTCSVADAKMKN